MIGCDIGYYSSFLDDAAARTLWTDLDMVTAGWVLPAGTARRVDGGYVVDGRWSFGSGCTHADVIVGGCVVHDHDGNLEIGPDGQPVTRIIAAPAEHFSDPRHLAHHRPRRQRQQRLLLPTAASSPPSTPSRSATPSAATARCTASPARSPSSSTAPSSASPAVPSTSSSPSSTPRS